MRVLHGSHALSPQSKDLEQQLQEELLEVVSELQMVRMGQGALRLREAITSHPPKPGLRRRTRCPGDTWVLGSTGPGLSPYSGPRACVESPSSQV